MGQYDRAISHLRSSLAMLASDRAHEHFGQYIPPALHARAYLAYSLAWQGDFVTAMEEIDAQGRIAASAGHPESRKMAHESRGLVYVLHGDPIRAIAALEQSLALAGQIGGRSDMASSAFVGYAYALSGRTEEAVTALRRSLDLAAQSGHLPCASLWQGWLAEAQLAAGQIEAAEQTGARAVEMARANQERGFEGEAQYRLGEITLQAEPLDVARSEQCFHDALAIAEELGMRPLQAHCHLGLGKLYRRIGRMPEARAALDVAVDLYLSMEMAHWIPEAEAELTEVLAASSAELPG